MPLICNYYVTLRCNARCPFCSIWSSPFPAEVDAEAIVANFPDLRRLGVTYIDFTGGEPLLRRDLHVLLAEAKRQGFRTTVTTHTQFYPRRARQLAGLVDRLNFSVDGPTRAEHEASRGLPVFDTLLESLRVAEQLGESPILLYTVTPDNYRRLPELVRFARARRVLIWVNLLFDYFQGRRATPEAVAYLRRYVRHPWVCVNTADLDFAAAGGNRREAPRCRAGDAAVVISPDNALLLPCYHHALARLPIRGDLYRVYHSPEARRQRESQGRHDFCEGCTIWCYMNPSFLSGAPDRYTVSMATTGVQFWLKHRWLAIMRQAQPWPRVPRLAGEVTP